jgi:uncharacterized protein (TIGR03435 family)
MKLAGVMLILFSCAALSGQTPDAKPAFEVASIKPAHVDFARGYTLRIDGGPGTHDPGVFTCENCSVLDLLVSAYGVDRFQVTAPSWTEDQRFTTTAKIPEGATKEQFKLMMQNLLAERFKLAVHRESKDMLRSELVVAKSGLKLKPSVEEPPHKDDEAEADKKPPEPEKFMAKDGYPAITQGMAMGNGRARMVYPRQTMDFFATSFLSGQLHHPVIDATGLTGKYDFALFWDMSAGTGASDLEPGPTLIEAVQSQLGLKLEQKKGPVEIIVVDHMERVPTEN